MSLSEKERLAKKLAKAEKELAKLKLQYCAAKNHISVNSMPPAGECKVRLATDEELATLKGR